MTASQTTELIQNSQRFEEGTLVGYNLTKGPALGVVTKSGPGVVRLFIRNQKEFPVKINSVFVQGCVHSNKSRPEWVRLLEDLESESEKARIEMDLSLLHESVLDSSQAKGYPLDELVDAYFGEDFSLFQVMGLARALADDRCYFKRRKDQFTPSTSEQIQEYFRIQEKLAQKQRQEEETVLFLQSPEPVSGSGGDGSPVALETLIDLSVHFERSTHFSDYKDLLSRAGIQTRSALRRVLIGKHVIEADFLFEVHEAHFPACFSKSFLAYLEGFQTPQRDDEPGRDLRDLETFTIDAPTTRDRDDAVSFDPSTSTYYVHITNVAGFTNGDARIEKECFRRLTSLYLPQSYLPMLPEGLVEQELSLEIGREYSVLTASFRLLEDDFEFEVFPCKIRVDYNYSYEEFDSLGATKAFQPFFQVAEKLRERRFQNGAFHYQHREISFVERDDRVVPETRPSFESQEIIAELSIMANSIFARYCRENHIPIFYRSQKGSVQEGQREKFSRNIHSYYEYYKLRGSWGKTRWDLDECSHVNLGVDYYTQMTSPIRRFIDYLNQKQLWGFFSGAPVLPAEEMGELLLRIQGHLFEVNGVQQKRQLYWLLRYFQQELDDSKDSCFRTPAMVLGQGEDWVLFHLDEFEKSYRWAQNPSGLKPSDPCECVIRSVDLIAREMTGVLEVADRNQGEKRN